jgi:hypothetical protein
MDDVPQIAFVDEYGNANLDTDKSGVSTHFIVSAVIVAQTHVDNARALATQIRDKYYRGGELKSSKVSKKDDRRLAILQEFADLPVHYYSVVVDKRSIDKSSGLIYKQPFLKFLNGLLHRQLFRTFPNLRVVSDQHGYPAFMEGFQRYVEERHVPDLFLDAEFAFAPSHEEVLIQVADIVAGTLARVYDTKKMSAAGRSFLMAMNPQTLGIDEWPPRFGFGVSIDGSAEDEGEADEMIREMSLNQVVFFIQENIGSQNEAVQYQVEALKYLLYSFRFLNPSHYVSTKRLLEVMEQFNGSQMSGHYFRSNVVAPLRDQSILIASSSSGYKLPNGSSDLLRTVDQFGSIISPMLSRLSKARHQIRLGTKGGFDLLGARQHEQLLHMIESTEQTAAPLPSEGTHKAPPVDEPPAPVEEIETAPCPMCEGNLVLSTLQVGMNECPHCSGMFEAG